MKIKYHYIIISLSISLIGCGDLDNILGEETEPYRPPLDVFMKYE